MAARINSFREIAGRYDVVLCDVWGVLHNGVQAFASACEALAEARAAGLTVVLITNSPRPSPSVKVQIRGLGVPDEAYDRIVTSGDVTRTLIAAADKKIFFIGAERDLPLLEGLGTEIVSSEDAETVVCAGFYDDETETPEHYRATLTGLAKRKIPFICANPDLVVERGHRLIPCAGAIAKLYEELGGEARIAGKPYISIYRAALTEAKAVRGPLDLSRVIAVGDGMPTDVKGAQDAGFDLLYISAGIHAQEYMNESRTDEAKLTAFLRKEGASPKWWMPRLA
ncbi:MULTISPECIES: TIGR01459 family HAD-type hydrolase [Ensifer]|jgi:HAD superfamily hydrolase (TIGR01450 family)|uniref:TIGR01459 family HAD-type hydrolase n=1 Tax=Ensifer canadensis TaxID=555315 RepID=A0AAW4FFP6_9HYPH|nr:MULTISPECIES: TIGR01459 family HAD-type hydrolase [Ensifer]AHK43535.1 HAD-superfamily hydrolase, subfamily IIA [Ensifer adhaerens OV14]MDP9628269.1 HAD superfamily hydrolase (TIGR01450 family) [Ensifer adhaerens]KQU71737.1 HAD family hydrolase [Ensifer sp. Root31]KQW63355.1 HAD family hydrolase [Ensifer sp. Root1252]KQW85436.1 HAD family hydrolase [Ensifer sp. Root127]